MPEHEQCTLGSQAPQWTQLPHTTMTPLPVVLMHHEDVVDCTQQTPSWSGTHDFDWAAAMQATSFTDLLSEQYPQYPDAPGGSEWYQQAEPLGH